MRSKEEVRRIVEGFAKSGMARREYCARHGVAMTTLDYWRRAHWKQGPRLVEVVVEQAQPPARFALVLANGRAHRLCAVFTSPLPATRCGGSSHDLLRLNYRRPDTVRRILEPRFGSLIFPD